MTDQELRELVRDAITRHLGRAPATPLSSPSVHTHPSHVVFHVMSGGDAGGACLIEPAVRCNHCGYCQSFGH